MIFPLLFLIPMLAMALVDGVLVAAWTLLGWGLCFIRWAVKESHSDYMRRMRGHYPIDYERV